MKRPREPAPQQSSIFGGNVRPRAYTRSPKANGYAAAPGTGPEGETCGTCTFCRCKPVASRQFYKCALMIRAWSACRSTDVLFRSPACSKFQRGEPRVTGIK